MKFFTIPPIKYTDFMAINDNYFCLAPIALEDEDYFNYFKQKAAEGKHVILDNGAAEGRLVEGEKYIHLINQLKPTEAVAPDALYRGENTLMKLKHFKHDLQSTWNWSGQHSSVKIIGVPQGSTVKEWLKCYLEMVNDSFISTIGISKFAVKSFAEITKTDDVAINRIECITMLHKYHLDLKPLHCLGMRDPHEFQAYKNIPSVRSSDSAFTCLAATKGYDIFDCPVDIETPKEYFHNEITLDQYKRMLLNIKQLNDLYSLDD